jgi:hypothetical protein
MTAQPNLKSTGITNLDSSPSIRPGCGQAGGAGRLIRITDVVGPTTSGDTTGGILRACRIPSNCYLQSLKAFQLAATSTATFTISLYYSDNGAYDGTSFLNTGEIGTTIFSSSNWDSHAIIVPTELAFLNTSGYLPTDVVNPIWKYANGTLTKDPGGYFDIVFNNTATISGAATLIVMVDYLMPE